MREEYERIVNLTRPLSKKREKMSLFERSAQFAPFAALSGYESAISETARITEQRRELPDWEIEKINAELARISANLPCQAEIVYFIKDKSKSGGEYRAALTTVKRILECERALLTDNGGKISFYDILSIKQK